MGKRTYIGIILLVVFCISLSATHNRAGEITYRHLGGYSYEFTITTYTYRFSNANRSVLTVSWGDGFDADVPLLVPPGHEVIENSDYFRNIYVANHTFPGPGVYQILMEDPNRNFGVNNIPNSENVIFSIKTSMLIGAGVGANNTPVLLNPPIDKAARGHVFIHNPGAFDSDGDRLSYSITICTGANGEPIEGYVLPPVSDTLFIDEISGDLIWKTPDELGVYNIAILVDEWRQGLRIGRIARDMQIDVYDTENMGPINPVIPDICVVAGDSIYISTNAVDDNKDMLIQDMVGGPFEVDNPALFHIDSSMYGRIYSHFTWTTNCIHARKQPYTVVLKTEDVNDDINLAEITSFSISVLHQPLKPPVTLAGTDTIRIEWDQTKCGIASGYNVYRKLNSGPYNPDSCETGVPVETGYKFLDYVQGGENTYYTDDEHGNGLVPGNDYCYRITAVYSDGAESISSEEVCENLIPGTPPMLRVSVAEDDSLNGRIDLAWAVPEGIDTIDAGPYRYEILRKAPTEEDFSSIALIPSIDLTDTIYSDSDINTDIFPYTYSVVLHYQDDDNNWVIMPGNETATSQYIDIASSDNTLELNMKKRSPWNNVEYDIFRKNEPGSFNQISTITGSDYLDTALVNGRSYTYRTVGQGTRPLYGKNYLVENTSHLAIGVPVDTIPPCPPDLFVTSECDLDTIPYNILSWDPPVDTCAEQDVIAYIVYRRESPDEEYIAIDTLEPDIFMHEDTPENTIEICYAVTALDSALNESAKIPQCPLSVCEFYRLPNVFTPNGDDINDLFRAWNLNGYVKKVNMVIYNRYGKEVYRTDDPYINWDGKLNNKLVTSGVYYYICDVYVPRRTGIVLKTFTDFIHVYPGENNNTSE